MQTENRQVNTLYGVVSLFVLGHLPRVTLNVQEMIFDVFGFHEIAEQTCENQNPFWVHVSLLLIH